MEMSEEIVIVGAGVAGLTTSLAFHRMGVRSLVLESATTLRSSGYGILTWSNAWRALDAVGVADVLRRHHLPLSEFQIVSTVSGLTTSTTSVMEKGKCGHHEVRCLKRKLLLETLAKELPQGTIRFSSKVVSIEESGYLKLVHLADGAVIRAKVLIGCDGVNSVVAKWLGLQQPTYTGRSAARGMAEFPEGHGLEPKVTQHYGNGIRHGYLPCDEKSVYWFMTFFSSPQRDKEMEDNPSKIKQFVLDNLGNVPTQAKAIIERTELDSVTSSPMKMRWPWEIWWGDIHKGNVCALGDALHPMTPEIGQGGCSALEDAIVLTQCLAKTFDVCKRHGKTGEDGKEDEYKIIEQGLEKYAKARRLRSCVLVATAFLVGKVQQSDGKVMRVIREKLLSRFLSSTQLRMADFDCGKLYNT